MYFFVSLISHFSDSPTVMDTQHIQGEGVPPQAGKGQRHHRPDQRYLSLHPPTVSFCLSQRTTKQEAGRQIDPGRKNPLESGWPTDRLGFQIKGDYFKKRYRRVSVETHVPSEPKTPADWSREGGGTWGGLDLPGSCVTKRQSQRRSAGPALQRLPLQPAPLHVSHEWVERADVCDASAHRCRVFAWLPGWLDEGTERERTVTERVDGRGWVEY